MTGGVDSPRNIWECSREHSLKSKNPSYRPLNSTVPYITKLYTLTHSVDTSQSLLKGQRPMALKRPLMYLSRMTLVMIFTLQDQPVTGRDRTDDWFLLRGGFGVRLIKASKAVVVA
jgi:hypothetical protein